MDSKDLSEWTTQLQHDAQRARWHARGQIRRSRKMRAEAAEQVNEAAERLLLCLNPAEALDELAESGDPDELLEVDTGRKASLSLASDTTALVEPDEPPPAA